jgi:adenylyltransferase/sulfurtransferase
MKEISGIDLKRKLNAGEEVELIDVREVYEHEEDNIGGILVPLSSLMDHLSDIPKDKPVIMYCKKGIRSMIAIQRLSEKPGYNNLINLKGGIDAYRSVAADNG